MNKENAYHHPPDHLEKIVVLMQRDSHSHLPLMLLRDSPAAFSPIPVCVLPVA
jgi:hypothetical protein